MLGNRHYVGELRYGGKWLPAKWPAFIDPATFAAVERRLEDNRLYKGGHPVHSPFGRILRCSCGARLAHKLGRGEYIYYRCIGACGLTVAAENLEAAICGYLSVTPAWLNLALESGEWKLLHRSEEEAAAKERELIEKDAELANLVRLAGKGGAIGAHTEREADRLAPELERLRTEYQRLSRGAASVRADLERLAESLRFGAESADPLDTHILTWWEQTDSETKRATFATIFDQIEVGADYFGLAFRYGFPPGLIRLPFTQHKRHPASAFFRSVGFGAATPPEEGRVGSGNALGG